MTAAAATITAEAVTTFPVLVFDIQLHAAAAANIPILHNGLVILVHLAVPLRTIDVPG